jgi:hypothetical protein
VHLFKLVTGSAQNEQHKEEQINMCAVNSIGSTCVVQNMKHYFYIHQNMTILTGEGNF